jgi:hypothetical protein
VMQAIGGAVVGSIVGIVAWKHYDNPYGLDRRVRGDEGYTPNANIAYAIGSFVGSTVAVQLIGQTDGSRSPIWSTALGAGLGSIPGFLSRDEPFLPLLGSVFFSPLQGGLGMVGYQTSRWVK